MRRAARARGRRGPAARVWGLVLGVLALGGPPATASPYRDLLSPRDGLKGDLLSPRDGLKGDLLSPRDGLKGGPAGAREGRAFAHPLGLRFVVPPGWQVAEGPLGLQLTPPEPAVGPEGPLEIYSVSMVGADPGVHSLDAPEARALLLALLHQALPALRAEGPAEPVAGAPEVRRFRFAGHTPKGIPVVCRVYGRLAGGYFVSLVALGAPDLVAGRADDQAALAATLALEAPRADPELVGTWYANSSTSVGRAGDRLNYASSTRVVLLPGGRVASTTESGFSADRRATESRPGYGASGTSNPSREEGRWAVSGQDLYILWKSGGTQKYRFHLQGRPGRREMLLRTAEGRKLLWTEYNL